MPQKLSPFVEGKYGWDFGESGWNTGADENFLKFSFLFDRNVDGIVSTLPSPISGKAYFLTTDNRLYFSVNSLWMSTPTPLGFEFRIRSTGDVYRFSGTGVVPVESVENISSRLTSVELEIESLGSAAYQDTDYFASQANLDLTMAPLQQFDEDLSNRTDALKGAAIVGRAIRFFRSIRLAGGGDGELQTVAGQYDGETVQVLGYWDDMPGEGGGLYTWFATNTLPADGTVIVAPGGVAAGRWIMRPRETYFEDFGARGDGVTDDFTAMNLAVTSIYSKMFPVRMKSRTYASSQMLVVGDKVSLIGSGTFVSMIRALPGFVGTAVVQYYAPDSGINSVEIKNFRVSCNGQDVHGFDLRRMYDAVLISGLMCIDAPDTKNAFRLVGHTDAAPITIGQTVRIDALFMGHANSTATAATCYIQKLQEAVFTECKSWGCYGSGKAASVPWEIEDCRSLTFIQPSAVTSTGYGFKIRAIGRTTRNINLISPLYENIDGMIDAQGVDANFTVINVRQENPRYETVTTGGYNFAFTNSCEVDLFNRPATVASTAVQTLLYTGDASNISNSSTTTTILRRANAVSGRYSVGPALEVTAQDGSTVHFRTLEPSANTCSMMVAHNNGSTTTLKQVTVGAADSGGTGFRMLRVAN